MPFASKMIVALALLPALAACGSPAEESDEPLVQDQAARSDAILTAEPAVTDAPLASGDTETGGQTMGGQTMRGQTVSAQAVGTSDSRVAEAAPTPKPSPSASASPSPGPSANMVAAAATAPPIFAVCGACHAVEAGKNGIGPSLAGVFNSKAGSKAGFKYSDAMKSSGLTWNQATLDRYLEDPKGVVPGTAMAYNGLKNAQQRQAVIAYLKGL